MAQEGTGRRRTARCMCGSVRLSAVPKSAETSVCHCEMCQRWAAGPFFVVDCGDSVVFESDADFGVYRSSKWGERGFCKKCGTSLIWRLHHTGESSVSLPAFDDFDDVEFNSEIFVDEKPDYFSFSNETRKMTGAEVFAEFAAGQGN